MLIIYYLFGFPRTGGLFDEPTVDAELAFQFGVDAVNNQQYDAFESMFEAITMRIEYSDQFDASKKLCRLIKVNPESSVESL